MNWIKKNTKIEYVIWKILRLEHYDKLRKRWSKVKNLTQGIGIFLTVSLCVLTIVISSGVLVIPVVATALTGTGVFTTSLVTMLDKS